MQSGIGLLKNAAVQPLGTNQTISKHFVQVPSFKPQVSSELPVPYLELET